MAKAASRSIFRWIGMTACVAMLASCQPAERSLQDARDAIAATLPAAYFEDLVTESATIEGNRLVLLVRSPEGNAATTRTHERFDELRMSEQRQMRELCALPSVRPLFDSDAVLVRRFVDRGDEIFFETELPTRACARIDHDGDDAMKEQP